MLPPCCKLSSKVLHRFAASGTQHCSLTSCLSEIRCLSAGLLQEHKQLPDKMLQLMPLLENHGKKFADKSLISISGACCDANCLEKQVRHYHLALFLPECQWQSYMGVLMYADAQDKALIFQADAETSLLGAIRQVPNMVTSSNFALKAM